VAAALAAAEPEAVIAAENPHFANYGKSLAAWGDKHTSATPGITI
jgi:hypothetical protein